MCRAEGISFLIFTRARSPILKVKEVTTRTEYEVSRDDIVHFIGERIARQRRIDLATGTTPHANSLIAPIEQAPKPTSAPASRVPSTPDVQVILPERYDRRRERPRDGKIKPSTRNLLAERAGHEAIHIAEKLLAGELQVFAVDLNPAVFARFTAAVTAPDDMFKSLLDVALTAEERDYVKNLRVQIRDAIEHGAAGGSRVMLYAVREGRSVIVG